MMLNEYDMKNLWKDLDRVEYELRVETEKLSTIRENMQDLKVTLEQEAAR
jgi:hypothetical protein